jgi:hypothetical protein
MELNVGATRVEVNSRFSCAALSDALRQVTMQPNALTISDAACATLCCDIATVRRVSTNPGLFVVDSHTIYALWHAPCVVTWVDAISASRKALVAKATVFFKEGRLCSGQPQATRTCVLASKSRCTSRPAKTPNARGFLRAAPHFCFRSFVLPPHLQPQYSPQYLGFTPLFPAFFH